jgi:transcriptional regulator with XRE-family HTH domain
MSKLKAKRIETGLSQSQLAEKAELNVRVLQHYEQASKNFDHARIDKIIKVCLALNCKIDDILENQEYVNLFNKYLESQK